MRMTAPVLLVGSVPGPDAETVMRGIAAGVGDLCGCIPDGETGRRRAWINFLAAGAYDQCPALTSVNRPLPIDTAAVDEWRSSDDDWIPRGYTDHWQFRIAGTSEPEFASLGYAVAAIDSYRTFSTLRTAGHIGAGVRFMVALPLVESATRPFLLEADDYPAMHAAYANAVAHEIETMLSVIPALDLTIQWDIAIETVAIASNDNLPGVFTWQFPTPAFERYVDNVSAAAKMVPDEVVMGLHLCYGDLGHRHIIEPSSLGVCVRMANAGCEQIARPVDFYHMPVPRERKDADYFAPLSDLSIADGKLYLGLIHHTDGSDGARQRAQSARRYVEDFGVATECGFGRRPAQTISALYDIHREVVAFLST